MKIRIAEENTDAEKLIPPSAPDGSGIGVNYIDAYIKPLNTALDNGTQIACKRKGLKVILSVGDATGEAIMRRIEHGPDVKNILRKALLSAAQQAGCELSVDDGSVWLDV